VAIERRDAIEQAAQGRAARRVRAAHAVVGDLERDAARRAGE
jgi:hypothetical protein